MKKIFNLQPLSSSIFKNKVPHIYNDIYLVFTSRNEQCVSGISKNSDNTPIWHEQLDLILNQNDEQITCEIYDYKINNGQYIGYFNFNLSNLQEKQKITQCYDIKNGTQVIGQLTMDIEFFKTIKNVNQFSTKNLLTINNEQEGQIRSARGSQGSSDNNNTNQQYQKSNGSNSNSGTQVNQQQQQSYVPFKEQKQFLSQTHPNKPIQSVINQKPLVQTHSPSIVTQPDVPQVSYNHQAKNSIYQSPMINKGSYYTSKNNSNSKHIQGTNLSSQYQVRSPVIQQAQGILNNQYSQNTSGFITTTETEQTPKNIYSPTLPQQISISSFAPPFTYSTSSFNAPGYYNQSQQPIQTNIISGQMQRPITNQISSTNNNMSLSRANQSFPYQQQIISGPQLTYQARKY